MDTPTYTFTHSRWPGFANWGWLKLIVLGLILWIVISPILPNIRFNMLSVLFSSPQLLIYVGIFSALFITALMSKPSITISEIGLLPPKFLPWQKQCPEWIAWDNIIEVMSSTSRGGFHQSLWITAQKPQHDKRLYHYDACWPIDDRDNFQATLAQWLDRDHPFFQCVAYQNQPQNAWQSFQFYFWGSPKFKRKLP